MKKIIYLSIISFFLYAGKSEAQTILKGTIGSIGSVFKKKASNSNDSGKIPERVPVVGHYSLGIGMFNDVNENHPFSFDMYKFFQSNNILGPDSNYLNVKLTDRPGTTDYYMEGNIVYGYMDTCSWEFLPDIKKLERNYKKSWGNMYCNNLYYIFECKLYKGKELMEDFKDTMRRGIYDQKNNRYFFLFTAGGKGPTNKTTSNFWE